MPIILTQAQKQIARDKHRFRVLRCGRRFGKTTLAVLEMIAKAASRQCKICYIAPTFDQTRDIAWEQLKSFAEPIIINKNESRLELEVKTQHGDKSKIMLHGWESVDTLRGQAFDFLVLDEIRDMRSFKFKWQQVLRPTLTDRAGKGLFISTPNGFDHFYELCEEEAKDKDYKSFHFTSYDNPYMPKEEIDKAKLELNEDSFAQEYLADFRKFTGLIYKEFERELHVIQPIHIPDFWQIYRCMDFGAVNPTVCIWLAVDSNDTYYVFDEYFNSGQTAAFHAGTILGKTNPLHNVIATWGDPSAQQEMIDYASAGLFISQAIKNFPNGQDWVMSGINQIKNLLKPTGISERPRLLIFNNCKNIIREFESYHWMEKRAGEGLKDQPEKKDDHCMDALRYGIGSIQDKNYSQYSEEIRLETNQYSGYSGNII